jgi:hypothetical protein
MVGQSWPEGMFGRKLGPKRTGRPKKAFAAAG